MYVLTVFHLISAVSGLASGRNAIRRSTSITATFDDISVDPGTGLFHAPPTPYKGLNYTAAGVENVNIEILGVGLKPHTPPNVLFYGISTKGLTDASATLTVAKPYASFALRSLWAGCVISAAVLTIGEACTIVAMVETVSGARNNISLVFNPNANKTMQQFEFHQKEFSDARSVSFVTPVEDLPGVLDQVVTNIDSIEYELFE